MRAFVLLALALAGCTQPEADAPPDAAAPTTAREVASPWSADYAAMRTAAAAVAKTHVHTGVSVLQFDPGDGSPRTFDILDCADYDEEPGAVPPREQELELLARQVVVLETALRSQGYDAETIAKPLARYEQAALAIISSTDIVAWDEPGRNAYDEQLGALFQRLGIELEANRTRLQPEALPIVVEGGCGASESPTLVKADPPDGRVWLITRFAFDVCKARKLDAWKIDSCRWTEMAPDREAWLSGNYMVQASWPDGRSHRGSQTLEGGIESETPLLLTVRPG